VLYPPLFFCVGIGAAGMLSMVFFRFERNPELSGQPLLFLRSGKAKIHNSLERLRIELRSEMTIEKAKRLRGKSTVMPKYHNLSYYIDYRFSLYKPL